ncbi:SMAD/FHA domain-containing protein [Obba rivulosa]|uniref:SMAD/FHA domain-containing protein n=1 Tax=Obba rivulosa TaxID=1052685 RepID=A0A8E2DG47_9APHY|nr:SMAD/FHA domain-containing protein [Obba rivulosa]
MARESDSYDRTRYHRRGERDFDREESSYSRRRERDTRERSTSRDRDDRGGHDRRRQDDYSSYDDRSGRRERYELDKRPGVDRDRDRRRERGREDRAGPSRRSASPRRDRSPASRSKSAARSKSPEDKAKPNFNPSGLLAAATKTVEHVDGTKTVLKYHEPPEARKPPVGWRLYVFKGKEQVDLLHIHRQSAYLIGRDRTVCDITIEHPSCSKQHAVIQYRQVKEKSEFGDVKTTVKAFIIDLESTNGTQVNDEAIPQSRYYELKPGDVIKFGESAREYVLLHDDVA